MTDLNPYLIDKQELTEAEVEYIKHLHGIREELFKNMEPLNPENPEELEMLRHGAEELRDIEFALQRAWKFEENSEYHSWWFRIPHCTCPKLDNEEMVGVRGWWYSSICPIHSPDSGEIKAD